MKASHKESLPSLILGLDGENSLGIRRGDWLQLQTSGETHVQKVMGVDEALGILNLVVGAAGMRLVFDTGSLSGFQLYRYHGRLEHAPTDILNVFAGAPHPEEWPSRFPVTFRFVAIKDKLVLSDIYRGDRSPYPLIPLPMGPYPKGQATSESPA